MQTVRHGEREGKRKKETHKSKEFSVCVEVITTLYSFNHRAVGCKTQLIEGFSKFMDTSQLNFP